MHNLIFLGKGFLVGFSIAAPVGPIGVLCIRRTVHYGRFSGFMSGLGAATADAVFAFLAGLGLSVISDVVMAWQQWLRFLGGLFLVYLGAKIFYAEAAPPVDAVKHSNAVMDFVSTFVLTLSNPITIFAFMALFAGLGLEEAQGDAASVGMLVGGVLLGSACWWFLLTEGITLLRKRLSDEIILWISKLAGLVIASFGVITLVSLISSWLWG